MKFRAAEPDFNFLGLRLLSEGERWEIGYVPATFGRWQVVLGMAGTQSVELRYCCGKDPALRMEVIILVLRILLAVDEHTCTPAEIQRLFPKWTRRPIDLCPVCLPRLRELAAAADPVATHQETAAPGC